MDQSRLRLQEQEWCGLIARTAQGDQAALAELYDRTSPQVYGLALKILGDRDSAEEVMLDVYAQVWRQAHSFDEQRGSPGSWLMTIARTRAIDRFRAGYLERGKQAPLETAGDMPAEQANPEQHSVDQERQRLVQRALASLSFEQREVIALAYLGG